MTKEEYEEYLQTARWIELRSMRLNIDNFTCQRCGARRDLQVHHINYERVGGHEDVDRDLITLCRKCHKEVEYNKNEAIYAFRLFGRSRQEIIARWCAVDFSITRQREDYSGGGDKNYCNLDVLKPDLRAWLDRIDSGLVMYPKICIDFFAARRYQIILNHLHLERTAAEIERETRFSRKMIDKVLADKKEALMQMREWDLEHRLMRAEFKLEMKEMTA